MTVLVTGANGHLGRLTVHALLERGVEPSTIVATARDRNSIKDLADLDVETRRADYDDPASLDEAMTDVDRVLLVSSSAVGNRVHQHQNVIDAARRQGVSLLAYTSVLNAGSTSLLLAEDHVATEHYLAESGVPHLLLRNGWYLENYIENASPALESGTVYGAAGEGRISAAARRDFAEAAAVALVEGTPGQVHELGGDEAFTMGEYAATLAAVTGTEIVYADLPSEHYQAALESAGLPAGMPQVLADSDRGIAAGDLHNDSGTLSRLIGRPTTPLVDAVRAALA